jgi:hypothetical protein
MILSHRCCILKLSVDLYEDLIFLAAFDVDYNLFVSQLSDFGLASWASTSCNATCTDVAGTFG